MAADVRQARPDDAAAIARAHVLTWQHCYRGQMPDEILDSLSIDDRESQWARRLASEDGRAGVFVAEGEEGVVGFASCNPARPDHGLPGSGEVETVYLLPDWWGQGIGGVLLGRVVDRLARTGHTTAMLWVLEANDRARQFYEAAGWTWDGARQMYHRQGHDIPELRYVRDLS